VIDLLESEGHEFAPGRLEIVSTIPEAKGLSSSAALEVAVAGALLGETAPFDIARLCRRAENERVGVPCGLMDQAAAACAIAGHVMVLDCDGETFFHLPLPDMEILLVDPGLPRTLGDTPYRERLEESRTPGTPAARHVEEEKARVERGIELLDDGDIVGFGALLSESHVSLRDLYRCSHPSLDQWTEYLLETPGVHGARLVGGGWGGCVIAVAEPGTRIEHATNLVTDDGLSTMA
jgi:galactokinase